jgi:LacI family transcriptional regulator
VPSSGNAPDGVTAARAGQDGAPPPRRATLATIAAAAGVSMPTVSKVVNGRPDVAPATRVRVERLLDEHQYARTGAPRGRRAGLVDLVFNGLDSPWAVEILRGVEEWGADHETAVVVSAVGGGPPPPPRRAPRCNGGSVTARSSAGSGWAAR